MITESKKNGILIFFKNGCTTTDELVIISCQYNVNSKNDDSTKGNDNSLNAVATREG